MEINEEQLDALEKGISIGQSIKKQLPFVKVKNILRTPISVHGKMLESESITEAKFTQEIKNLIYNHYLEMVED